MKMIEIETSNGSFVVVDIDNLYVDTKEQYFLNYVNNFKGLCINDMLYEEFASIKDITEEQASEVVDEPMLMEDEDGSIFGKKFVKYDDTLIPNYKCFANITATESLHSLLKSKGVDKTWTNPYLFKKI